MYYVNREQIERRLEYLSTVRDTLRLLRDKAPTDSLIHQFALERAIHVAAECVTDIGSYMIDGFVMRDAASYEDIVEILFGENVFSSELFELLSPLVKMRKPLVQSYYDVKKDDLTILSQQLPEGIDRFSDSIVRYLSTELGDNK
jgi:uncharacterized protein YutE (UPF0331/DUF86 family)